MTIRKDEKHRYVQVTQSFKAKEIHGNKIIQCICYNELLKPSKTITCGRYRQQIVQLDQALKENNRDMQEDTKK